MERVLSFFAKHCFCFINQWLSTVKRINNPGNRSQTPRLPFRRDTMNHRLENWYKPSPQAWWVAWGWSHGQIMPLPPPPMPDQAHMAPLAGPGSKRPSMPGTWLLAFFSWWCWGSGTTAHTSLTAKHHGESSAMEMQQHHREEPSIPAALLLPGTSQSDAGAPALWVTQTPGSCQGEVPHQGCGPDNPTLQVTSRLWGMFDLLLLQVPDYRGKLFLLSLCLALWLLHSCLPTVIASPGVTGECPGVTFCMAPWGEREPWNQVIHILV